MHLAERVFIYFLYFILIVSDLSDAISPVDKSDIELKLVHLIWRHGDRNIEQTYPLDPYKDESFWPDGFGQLTRIGIHQHEELGKYFRKRYISTGFISKHFDPKQILVQSSGFNRTLLSALSNLKGFFKEDENELFFEEKLDLNRRAYLEASPKEKSEMLPVYIIPRKKDNKLLQFEAPCPRFNKLFNNFISNSSTIRGIMKEHGWLFNYLSKSTGKNVKDLHELSILYNNLYVQSLRNFTLPEWTKGIFPGGIMEYLASYAFKTLTVDEEMKRLKGGPLLKEIMRHIHYHVEGQSHSRRLYAYSGHDMTLTTILDTLGVFQPHQPDYAAVLMIELKKNVTSGEYFIDFLYKNESSRDPYILHPPGCPESSCALQTFIEKYQRFIPVNWNAECQLI